MSNIPEVEKPSLSSYEQATAEQKRREMSHGISYLFKDKTDVPENISTLPNSTPIQSQEMSPSELVIENKDLIEEREKTRKLSADELPQTYNVVVESTPRVIGQPKPRSQFTPIPSEFTHSLPIKAEKAEVKIEGREVYKNDSISVIRLPTGEYRVQSKDGIRASAMQRGNRIDIAVKPVGKGSRAAGTEYSVVHINLTQGDLDERAQDQQYEWARREKMSEMFRRQYRETAREVLPYLGEPAVEPQAQPQIPTTEVPPSPQKGGFVGNLIKRFRQ